MNENLTSKMDHSEPRLCSTKPPRIKLPLLTSYHKTIKPPNPPTPPIFTLPNTPPKTPSPSLLIKGGENSKPWKTQSIARICHNMERMSLANETSKQTKKGETDNNCFREDNGEIEKQTVKPISTGQDQNRDCFVQLNSSVVKEKIILKVAGQRSKKPTLAKEWRLTRERKKKEQKL